MMKKRCIMLFSGFVVVVIASMISRYYFMGTFPSFLAEMKLSNQEKKLSLQEMGNKVLVALSEKDFSALSENIAEDGVDVLPYPYEENLDHVQKIKKEEKSDFSSLFSGKLEW